MKPISAHHRHEKKEQAQFHRLQNGTVICVVEDLCVIASRVAMNGYIIISLENGLMLFTQTANNYGLAEKKDPLEISSYLYAIYSLSKSYYEDESQGEDSNQFNGVMSGSIATSFRESPLTYFQQVCNCPPDHSVILSIGIHLLAFL
jgi:hypothetical protein